MNPDNLYSGLCVREHVSHPTSLTEAADRYLDEVRHVVSTMSDEELSNPRGTFVTLAKVQEILNEERARRRKADVWVAYHEGFNAVARVRLVSERETEAREVNLDYPNDSVLALRVAVSEVAGYEVEVIGTVGMCTLFRAKEA